MDWFTLLVGLGGLGGALGGGALLTRDHEMRRLKRRFSNKGGQRIERSLRRLEVGNRRFGGYVRALSKERLARSAVHDLQVLGYRTTVELLIGAEWVLWTERCALTPLVLRDDQGLSAEVDLTHARMILMQPPVGQGTSSQLDLPGPVQAMLARASRNTRTRSSKQMLRWREWVLEDGAMVLADGRVERIAAADGVLPAGLHPQRAIPSKPRFSGTPRRPLVICDSDTGTLSAGLAARQVEARNLVPRTTTCFSGDVERRPR